MHTIPLSINTPFKSLLLISQGCLLVAGILAPWLALGALPSFRFGIWIDSEPTIVLYHLDAALFAAGIFLRSLALSNDSLYFIKLNPVLGLLGGLVALSLITLPFALDRKLSWYGLPQTGQGILSLVSFTCYLVGFKRLLQEGWGSILWINTVLSAAVIAMITLLPFLFPENSIVADWSPYVFSAFLAFMAIGLLALSLTSTSRLQKMGGIGLSCALILFSSNKTAIIGLVVLGGVLITYSLSQWVQKNARLSFSWLVGMTPIIAVLCMVIFSSPTQLPSIWSRVRLMQMVGLEMIEHPLRLFVGLGWGSYTQAFLANLTRVSEAMYQQGQWDPTWDALERIDFHSHHQGVEALLSTGIIGALIILLLPAMATYFSNRDKLLSAFSVFFLYALTSSAWFEMPTTLPFVAVCYAAFWPQQPLWQPAWNINFLPWLKVSLSGMALVICFMGGIEVFKVGISYPSTSSFVTKNFGASKAITCSQAMKSAGPGNVHLAHSLRSLANEASFWRYANKQVVEELSELACAADMIPKSNMMLTISLLALMGDIAKVEQFPWVRPLREKLLPKWPSLLKSMLIQAPYRTDLLAPYFRWQLRHGNEKAVMKWCDEILTKNSQDPIALWFKGSILYYQVNQKATGRYFLGQALSAGIDRILPVK